MAKEAIIRNDVACLRHEFVAAADIKGGEVVGLGTAAIGIAITDIANAATGVLSRVGIATFPATSSDTWTVGTALYWNDSSAVLTTTSTSNAYVGVAHKAKTSGQTTADVAYGKL